MAVVAPSGMFSLGVEAVMDFFASLAAVQTWMGLTPPDVAGAKARMFLMISPDSIDIDDGAFMIFGETGFPATQNASGPGPLFTDEAAMSIEMYEKVIVGENDAEINNPQWTLLNNMGAICAAARLALGSGATRLDLKLLSVGDFGFSERTDTVSLGQCTITVERGNG